ncbi:hypothetical protein HF521_019831 [Silurus meridionalis]|uniref:Ig-like domain-containing protein n=1 Tax=Silurus meridionalis TaxID=175797 RepID=A0A8T0BLT8_SILME|nr:hypothetical protein HF521_019831 [Silurus meridionalis]
MTVEWYRLDVADMLVHLYKDREDRNEKQAQTYRGRTSVFKEELQKGNASLKLSALTLSDEGEYKCLVVDKSRSKDITVHVVVEVQGSKPVITMESYDNSGGINLVCGSRGWKPEPKVLWMDRNGVTLPAEDTQIHRDTELFSVKRRITVHVHDKSDSNRFYCRLQQNHHMKETEVIINSPFFAAGKWIVGISVLACLIAVGLIFISVLCYKKDQQKRTKEKEINELKNNAEVQKKRIEEQEKQKNNDDQKIKELEEANQKLQNSSDQQIQDLKKEIKVLKNKTEVQKKTIEEQEKQKNNDGNYT